MGWLLYNTHVVVVATRPNRTRRARTLRARPRSAPDSVDTVFMLAGPVKIDPRVLQAMTRSVINHRGAEFRKVNADVREGLRYVFQRGRGRGDLRVGHGGPRGGDELAAPRG